MPRAGRIQGRARHFYETLRGWPKWLRMPVGMVLLVGGILGFLPVLGFWMVPLGLAVLAIDIPVADRACRWLQRKWTRLRQRLRKAAKSDA